MEDKGKGRRLLRDRPKRNASLFMGMDDSEMRKPIMAAGSTILIFLTIGTIVYHKLENWSWIDSLYFSTFSLTTVGYGDIAPTHESTRLFTVFYLLTGVGAVVASLGVIGERYIKRRDRIIHARQERKKAGEQDNGD